MKKTAKIIIGLLLAAIGLPASAQRAQDALYIFRNDGQFNAFFWGDIQRFAYSKVDTLGVEHDDYVVQEVYALDSVFRIPVSAIDSIAFVTPENKVKSDVVIPDKSIADYIVASDSLYWIRLAPGTPQALIPKKGDKLLIEQKSRYIPQGFGGLVTAVTTAADGITVMTGPLQITDVYDRLVAKAAAATPRNDGGLGSRQRHDGRRLGILDGYDGQLTPEDTLTLPTLTGTWSLNHSRGFLPDGLPIQISGDITGSISASIEPKLALRAFLFLDVLSCGFNYTQDTYLMLDSEYKTSLSGALNARMEVPFGPSFKKTIGEYIEVEAGMGLFLEGSVAGFELATTRKQSTWTWNRLNIDIDDLVEMSHNPAGFTPHNKYTTKLVRDTTEYSVTGPGQMSVGFGAFAKVEATFAIPLEKTPKFIQKTVKAFTAKTDTLGFGAEVGVEAGVRLEANVPFWSVLGDYKLIDSQPIYKKFDAESQVSLAGYLKFASQAKVGNWSAGAAPDATLKSTPLALVPRITGISVIQDPTPPLRPWRWLAKAPISRDMFLGAEVGFAVFDQQKNLVADSLKYHYWFREKGKQPTYDYTLTNIDPLPGRPVTYTVYPMVEIFGDFNTPKRLLVDRSTTVTLEPARIDMGKRMITLTTDLELGGSEEVTVTPNMSIVNEKSEAKWLTPYWFPERNELSVHWEGLPKGMTERRGVIRLTGLSHKGDTIATDSVVVVQQSAYIALHPDKLSFGKQGGTQVVTIDSTNVESIAIQNTSDGITATLNGNKLTITVAPNSGEVYTSHIILEGKTKYGLTGNAIIEISQDGKSPDGPQPGESIDVEAFSFEFIADGLKRTSVNDPDPDRRWGVGEGPQFPLVFRRIFETPEETSSKVAATIGDDAIHVTVGATDEEYESYRATNSPIKEYETLSGKCSYTLEFDIEKYLDDEGKPAARVTNVTLRRDARENWSEDSYELHRLNVNIDPSAIKAKIIPARVLDFPNGYVTVGYKGIQLSQSTFDSISHFDGVTTDNGLHIPYLNYDFTYYYPEQTGWDEDFEPIFEIHRYDASYSLENESSDNSLYIKIDFPESIREAIMKWFEKAK